MKTIKDKSRWLVLAAYDYAAHHRGEIISQHQTYAAAERKANRSTMWQIINVDDYTQTN